LGKGNIKIKEREDTVEGKKRLKEDENRGGGGIQVGVIEVVGSVT
jgi:hypothetical protein